MTQQVLAGKTGVVFGVANKRSIAWAIAKAWAAAGARLIFNYQGERLKENVEELTGEFGEKTPLFPCDVTSDDEIKAFFENVRAQTDHVDLMLHSLAYAPRDNSGAPAVCDEEMQAIATVPRLRPIAALI